MLVAGLVRVLKTPISERYCKVGDDATLDVKNKQIRCGGLGLILMNVGLPRLATNGCRYAQFGIK
jgi:hypothetical protein